MSGNPEEEEKSAEYPEKNEMKKETSLKRNEILVKARAAKKQKKENLAEDYNSYSSQLENIHCNLKVISTQMNTLTSLYGTKFSEKLSPEPVKEIKEVKEPKEETKPKENEYLPFINSKYSGILGEAVALAISGGVLLYFKTKSNDQNNISSRYSALH